MIKLEDFLNAKKKYTKEFREEVINLVEQEGVTVVQVSRDLGVKATTIHNWLRKKRAGVLGPSSSKSQELSEVNRLRKENRELRLEREILKKATAFCAKQKS